MKRFWNKVEFIPFHECWEWTGAKLNSGYGQFGIRKDCHYLAHRFSWIIHYGKIQKNLFVCHKCDNRLCVRPDHLFLGTNKDNMADMVKKGRQNKAKGADTAAAKLSESDVLEIRKQYPVIKSQRKLAKKYGVSRNAIACILHKTTWSHV